MSFKVSHVAQGVHTVSFVVSTILGTQRFEAKRGLDGFSIKDWCVEFNDICQHWSALVSIEREAEYMAIATARIRKAAEAQ